jgi:Na+/proline symporter
MKTKLVGSQVVPDSKGVALMRTGTSIAVIALGAIFKFAIHVHSRGFSLATVGVILMAIGIVGLLLGMTYWRPSRTEARDQSGEVVEERRVYERPSQL